MGLKLDLMRLLWELIDAEVVTWNLLLRLLFWWVQVRIGITRHRPGAALTWTSFKMHRFIISFEVFLLWKRFSTLVILYKQFQICREVNLHSSLVDFIRTVDEESPKNIEE